MSMLKSETDQKLLRQAGHKLAEVIQTAGAAAKPGVSLLELNALIDAHIRRLGCRPSFLGHEGFPKSACLSLNDQVVHGIPDGRTLVEGDILGIDVGLWQDHVCVDGADTFAVGTVSDEANRLLQATQKALKAGIKAAKPFGRVGLISAAVQAVAERENLGIVRALVGHGVGHAVWEPPQVPNYGHASDGPILRPGMVIAIEPMLTLGGGDVQTEIDGWGIVTADGSLAAQFEHTVLITATGREILTRL
jgi:methionyl aminopeptidase